MAERRRKTGSWEIPKTTGSNDAVTCLFVYSTMRSGQIARSLIANAIERSAAATTTGQLYVFPMGDCALVEGEGVVHGEVLWLSELAGTFALLDAYEGADFVRVLRTVTVPAADGARAETLWSWCYVLADPSTVRLAERLEHGDWLRYWSERMG